MVLITHLPLHHLSYSAHLPLIPSLPTAQPQKNPTNIPTPATANAAAAVKLAETSFSNHLLLKSSVVRWT